MKISDISLKDFEISGNAQIRMEGSGLSVTAGEHGGSRTPKWRSLAEKVTLCMSGRMRNGISAYSVLSFDGQGNENTVQTEEIVTDSGGRFSICCSFDPISLAVYQNAACFQIAVTAVSSGMEMELDQFSLSEETHSQIRKIKNSAYAGGAAISVSPHIEDRDAVYHRNIIIEDNTFEMHEERFLYAANVENLIFRNNHFLENPALPAHGKLGTDGVLIGEGCRNIEIEPI